MADSGLRIVKIIGLLLAILTFIFVIVACVMNSWSECTDMGYSSGLWFYKDKSTDMRSLYEENFIRAIQPDAKCTGKVTGNWNTDDTKCNTAFKCDSNSQVSETKSCSSNYQFDKTDGTCKETFVTKIQISGCQHPDCYGKVDGKYFLDKSTCDGGYTCSASGLVRGANVTCSGDQLFNSATGSCTIRSTDGSTCKAYYVCQGSSDSTLSTSTCSSGTYFNGTMCIGMTISGNDNTAPASCKHEDCVGKVDGPHRSGTHTTGYTYDVQCKKSYICKNSGQTRENLPDCTGSLQYTPTGSPPTCAAAPQSGCVASSCSGKADGYHITDSGTCRNYIKCRQGVEESTVTCPVNNFAIVSTLAASCSFHRKDSTCSNYYTCSGTTVTEQTCASGKYYNEGSKACEDPVSSGGGLVSTLPVNCKHADCPSDGTYYAKTGGTINTACNNAYTCASNVRTTLAQCPAGQQYQLTPTVTCTTTHQSGCDHADCSGKSDGYHVTDGTTCKNYINCENNGAKDNTKSGTCTAGRVFLVSTGTCSTTTPSGSTTCKDPRCDANPNHKAHQSTTQNPGLRNCQTWYECKNGFYTEGTCGTNEYYDLSDGVCKGTFPYTGTDHASRAFTCKDDRCFGLSDGKHWLNSDCFGYKECTNQIQTSSTTCPSGTLYDPNGKSCVAYDNGINGKHAGCKINGGHGAWGAWSTCTNNKGNSYGLRTRSRPCDNPTKKNGGAACTGGASEQTICWLCPTQELMEVTRFFVILAIALGGLGSIFALNTFCVSSSMYPTVLSSLCQLGVFVFALGSAVAYTSIYPKDVDSCFTTGAGWTLAIVAAVFAFIGFIVWIVAAIKVYKSKATGKVGARE
eukprot:TCONS_00010253-protein